MKVVYLMMTHLLLWLVNLGIELLTGIAAEAQVLPGREWLEPDYYDQESGQEDIDVHSISSDELDLDFTNINLRWNSTTPPVHFQDIEKLELSSCTLNPNSMTFSESLISFKIYNTEFINGTLTDLLKSAINLQHLELNLMGQVDLSKLSSAHFKKLNFLALEDTTLRNGTLRKILNEANGLQTLRLKKAGDLDISDHKNHFGHNLIEFEIQKTRLIHGSLYHLLVNASKIQILTIKDMDDLDISNWDSNDQFFSLSDKCKTLHIDNTKLKKGTLEDLLKNANNLEGITIKNNGDLDFSESIFLNTNNQVFQKLKYMTIMNTTLLKTTLYVILKSSPNIQLLRIGQWGKTDVSNMRNLKILEKLSTAYIQETEFVNGNLNDILKPMANLKGLTLRSLGKADLSDIPFHQLLAVTFINVTLTRDHSYQVRFEKLRKIQIYQSEAEHGKPLFLNFDKMFPNIEELDTGSKMIIHPNILLSMLNSSATFMTFSFDFDPPVKTYEFGEVMKILSRAGYTHGGYSDFYIETFRKNVSAVQRVHYMVLGRMKFRNGSFTEWILQKDSTSQGNLDGTRNDIKPIETRAIIYSYFIILLLFIGFGTTGNILSGIALARTKLETSAGVILFSLTFFDTGVILTYLISAYFNAELFYRMFVMAGTKSTEYTADEHLWLTKQNPTLAFFIYPLNKTAYTASVYTTVLISLERFIAICWPLKSRYLLHRRNSKRTILTILLFSIVLNIPRWIESYEWNYYSEVSPNWNDYYKPTLMRMENYRTIYHGLVWTIFMYILPYLLVAYFNFKIFRQTKASQKVRRTLQSTSPDHSGSNGNPEMTSLTKMLLTVVGVFVVCNSAHIAIVFYFLIAYDQIQLSTTEAVSCLPIVINCSVNFIIYVFLGKTLRAEFLKLIPVCLTQCTNS